MFGGISGVLAASGISTIYSAFLSSAINGLQYAVNANIQGKETYAEDLFVSMAIGFLSGLIPRTGINAREVSGKWNTSSMHIKNAVLKARKDFYSHKKNKLIAHVVGRSAHYTLSTVGSSAISGLFSE